MCNVPCELCSDGKDCDLYFNQLKILENLKKSEKTNFELTDKYLSKSEKTNFEFTDKDISNPG